PVLGQSSDGILGDVLDPQEPTTTDLQTPSTTDPQAPSTSDLSTPSSPSSPTSTVDQSTPVPKPKPSIELPPVMYVPPYFMNVNMNATDPFFPTGSESCQQCKFFYPKLKECDQVANATLAALERYKPNSTEATEAAAGPAGPASNTTYAPAEFTTILPFLKCICPNQGLPAIKVCMTCFRVSNQRNFLSAIEAQNVSTSLSSFQEACLDSGDGEYVPPSQTGGDSASTFGSSGSSGSLTGGFRIVTGLFMTLIMVIINGWFIL
ncbi:hypothetical protein BGZ76_006428, partial [Entomortierella beljakovae]